MMPAPHVRGLSSLAWPVAAALCLLAGVAEAQPRPRPLVVESINENPGWFVQLSSSSPDNTFKVGDTIRFNVVSEKDGYLYLFNIDSLGVVTCLFPNHVQNNNLIKRKQMVTVPDPSDEKFQIKVQAIGLGTEHVKAVVTTQPVPELNLNDLTRNVGGTEVKREKLRQILLRLGTGKRVDGRKALEVDLQDEQDKLRQQNPGQAAKLGSQYAEANLTITTVRQKVETREKRYALVIGVDKYRDQSIRELLCCVNDARDIAEALQARCSIPKENLKLLTNERATLGNIRVEVEQLVARTKPGDTVIIYWSGHGGRCANVDMTEPDGLDAYLVPHDGSIESDSAARKTMLLDKTFGRWVQELAGRRLAVILDTCHSGGQIEGMKSPRKIPLNRDGSPAFSRGVNTKTVPTGVNVNKWTKQHFLHTEVARMRSIGRKDSSVLTACTFKQFAFERMQKDHGVMTYYILKALSSESGRSLRIQDLHKIAYEQVKKYVDETFPGSPQTPVYSDDVAQPAFIRP